MEPLLAILEDAAEFEIRVHFHGCTVPRGWRRTNPHLISREAVRGALFHAHICLPGWLMVESWITGRRAWMLLVSLRGNLRGAIP